jgi:micrococcal nuclease
MKRLILVLLLFSGTLQAQTIRGRVVGVSDGDTIKVSDNVDHTVYKIRLYGIDAPEKTQPYGTKSKEALSDRIRLANDQVTVQVVNRDRYGRLVAVVYPCHWNGMLGDCELTSSLNEDQVLYGWAWAYIGYLKKKDREKYQLVENIAKSTQAGLWAMKNPTPPWNYRRAKKRHL